MRIDIEDDEIIVICSALRKAEEDGRYLEVPDQWSTIKRLVEKLKDPLRSDSGDVDDAIRDLEREIG